MLDESAAACVQVPAISTFLAEAPLFPPIGDPQFLSQPGSFPHGRPFVEAARTSAACPFGEPSATPRDDALRSMIKVARAMPLYVLP